jgi:hypothetical protein
MNAWPLLSTDIFASCVVRWIIPMKEHNQQLSAGCNARCHNAHVHGRTINNLYNQCTYHYPTTATQYKSLHCTAGRQPVLRVSACHICCCIPRYYLKAVHDGIIRRGVVTIRFLFHILIPSQSALVLQSIRVTHNTGQYAVQDR